MDEVKKLILEKIKLELRTISETSSRSYDKEIIENSKMLSEIYKNLKEE